LKKLKNSTVERFFQIVNTKLVTNPYTGKKLKGKYLNLWRIKAVNYRIIYEIDNKKLKVFILKFGHRQNIYNLL
jgi:mRNA-degrading endonuclease RelE of RelBE toxin-antitoxin system